MQGGGLCVQKHVNRAGKGVCQPLAGTLAAGPPRRILPAAHFIQLAAYLLDLFRVGRNDRRPELAPVVARRGADAFAEGAVEIRDVVEPAAHTDLGDRVVGLDDHLCGAHDAEAVEVVPQVLVGVLFEKTADRSRGHAYLFADVFERDLTLVIALHELYDLVDPGIAVGLHFVVRGTYRPRFVRPSRGQVVEYVQEKRRRCESPQPGQLQ